MSFGPPHPTEAWGVVDVLGRGRRALQEVNKKLGNYGNRRRCPPALGRRSISPEIKLLEGVVYLFYLSVPTESFMYIIYF